MIALIKTAFNMFLDKPILGHGPKMFRVICKNEKYQVGIKPCDTHPHNFYIQLLAETGIIGFSLGTKNNRGDKKMTHQWDNKKPTAQMLGRWQPFHDGHYTLFKEIIKKTGQVCIQIRDVQGVDDNPFDFETVKKNIEDRLNPEFEGQFKIMLVPNITNICYGRGVGYKIEEIVLDEETQKISATKIRAKMREEGKLK